jgi:hypothetical protein
MTMRRWCTCLILLFGVAWAMAANPAWGGTGTPTALLTVQKKTAAEFGRLDSEMKQAAAALGTAGLVGDRARSILKGLCGKFSYAVDCTAIDPQGKMVTVEPAAFKFYEGKDISGQEQVAYVIANRKPVLSPVFQAVEGFTAVDIEYPIANAEGRFLGSVSLLFKPEKFLGDIVRPEIQGMPLDIWAMEKEGLILYDIDPRQNGLNLFTSRLYRPYTELIRLGRRISKMPEGSGSYWFLNGPEKKTVKKNAHWLSVSLHGTAWRLVVIHTEQDPSGKDAGTVDQKWGLEKKLEAFAKKDFLITALAGDNKSKAMKYLKEFFDHTPGIYSVQWVNDKGINRFGFPAKNSLSDYDYHLKRTPGDSEIIKFLAEKKQIIWEKTLMEGKTGVFTFSPVFKDKLYLGMVYVIRLKPE